VRFEMKKTLPKLSSNFTPAAKEKETDENGRIRSTPHIQGQWSTHVYLDLPSLTSSLSSLLCTCLSIVRLSLPNTTIHPLLEPHVSLTRPLSLSTSQIDDFALTTRKILQDYNPFSVSFNGLVVLDNDSCTTRFVAMEIGSGKEEIARLVRRMDGVCDEFRVEGYYKEPRFHVSLGWWIPAEGEGKKELEEVLERELGPEVRREGRNLQVTDVQVKIGKKVETLKLS